MRTITIDDVVYFPRTNVIREGNRWRVQVERVAPGGKQMLRASFSDHDYDKSTAAALEAAHAWLDRQNVRAPFTGIDLSRKAERRVTLTRRVRRARDGIAMPHYELEIAPSKSVWRRPWMRIYLGTVATADQARIDDAIGRLRARWDAFKSNERTYGRDAALDMDYRGVGPAALESHSTRLSRFDMLAWNGRGSSVGFTPAVSLDACRESVHWPELYDLPHRKEVEQQAAA